jgi:hypothetical protein
VTSTARDVVRGVAPKLIDLSEKVLFGDVWERPGLSKRDRSFITVAALIAMYRTDQLPGISSARWAAGVTREGDGGSSRTSRSTPAGPPPTADDRLPDLRREEAMKIGFIVSARWDATWRPT